MLKLCVRTALQQNLLILWYNMNIPPALVFCWPQNQAKALRFCMSQQYTRARGLFLNRKYCSSTSKDQKTTKYSRVFGTWYITFQTLMSRWKQSCWIQILFGWFHTKTTFVKLDYTHPLPLPCPQFGSKGWDHHLIKQKIPFFKYCDVVMDRQTDWLIITT